jgi:hypothetical protein
MSRATRLALVDRDDPAMPVTAQCRLLKVARSTLYHRKSLTQIGSMKPIH